MLAAWAKGAVVTATAATSRWRRESIVAGFIKSERLIGWDGARGRRMANSSLDRPFHCQPLDLEYLYWSMTYNINTYGCNRPSFLLRRSYVGDLPSD